MNDSSHMDDEGTDRDAFTWTSDSRLANVARIYDALLGGKDNYRADREAARELIAAVPDAAYAARENRAFLGRAVRFLAAEAGIDQFIDIGTGLPVRGHVHEIAQDVNPAARVLYADNDPIVIAHARALLDNRRSVIAVEGDVRYPRDLLAMPAVRDLIDFGKPVAVLLIAVLHFVSDSEDPWLAVSTIMDRMPPGSYLAISHVTTDAIEEEAIRRAARIYDRALVSGTARSREDILRMLGGLELVPPGLADVAEWRSARTLRLPGRKPIFLAGIGRKPGGREAA